MKINQEYIFTGNWVAGFTQSDGSFVVSFDKQSGNGLPIRPRPIFNLTQSITELKMFEALHSFLGIGRLQKNKNNITLVVTSIEEIVSVLIPFFERYPLPSALTQASD